MADFNKITNGIAGGLGVVGSLLGDYYNTPKAQSNQQYMNQASQYANQNYKASDMTGLMSQYNNRGQLPVINRYDLFNPSQKEVFSSLFGAGLGAYGAAENLTQSLLTPIEQEEQTAEQSNDISNLAPFVKQELDKQLPTTVSQNDRLDYVNPTIPPKQPKYTNNPATNIVFNNKELQDLFTPKKDITYNQQPQPINKNDFVEQQPMEYALGGALQAGINTGVDLLTGGLGIALNYAGMKNEQRKAQEQVDSYNASRLYAEQMNQHNFNNAVTDSKNNMFNQKALQLMAEGGTLFTQGLSFPLNGGYREINEGGTHEQNIYDGVPQGLAADGQQNLVEEGEVIWNDYVFSNSRRKDKKSPDLKLPQDILDKYKDLKENMTFADAAKKLSEEAKERPNDYLSQNGLKIFLGDLRNAQEGVKQELEAKRMKRAINKMSPDELMQLQAMLSQGQNGNMFATGGHLFEGTKEQTNQMNRVNNLLSSLNTDQLYELGSLYNGYDRNNFTTTDLNPIKQFILSKQNNYDKLLETINQRMVLPTLQNLPDYTYNTVDATDWDSLLNTMSNYVESSKKANSKYKYYADPKFIYDNKNAAALQKDDNYNKFTEYVLANPNNENVQRYLKMLDDKINTEQGAETLFDENGNLKEKWADIFKNRRYDDIGGIYHFFQNLKDKTQGNRTIYRLNGQNVVVDNPDQISKFLTQTGSQNVVEFDENGNPLTTTYIDLAGRDYEVAENILPEDKPVNALSEIPRYAPVLGSIIGSLQSLTEQPRDYSTSITPRQVTYTPIGDYLEYNPVDTQRYINAVNQQAAAQNANIMNASGANKNAAIANMMFQNNQRQQNLAEILSQAEQINTARKQQATDFNRNTNATNAQAYNAAEQANIALNSILLNQAQTNANMRYNVDTQLDAAKSANLTNLFNNLGAIGRENLAYNQANSNKALAYAAGLNEFLKGISSYKG